MSRILLTAFAPYGRWSTNASWLALQEVTRDMPAAWQVTTRRYPVDFDALKQQLLTDLSKRPDFVLMLGQAPGAACIQLEAIGLNIEGRAELSPNHFSPLIADGPAAYQSTLPLGRWATALSEQGIPAVVSHHAGTYLCNAALYLAHYYAERQRLSTQAAFIHLPLDVSQVLGEPKPDPSLAASIAARAVRWMLEQVITKGERSA